MDKIYAIVNPVSANGTTAKEWPGFETALKASGYDIEAVYTSYPLHAEELARKAIKEGYKTIMSVGGDGTINEVVNGFFENGQVLDESVRLVVFSRGTGCDFIRSLGISKGIEDLLLVLERNREMKMDVGLSRFIGYDGEQKERYFLNVSDIGLGGETTDWVNKHSKTLKGFLSFLIGAFMTIIKYKNKYFEIVIDDEIKIKGIQNSVIIANGQYYGGGMRVAPEASMNDGLFDIVIYGDLSKPDIIKSFPMIYKGTHMKHPKLTFFRGKKVKVHCRERALVEFDGEQPGTADAEYEIIPSAIKVLI